jgi:hypothetical protein
VHPLTHARPQHLFPMIRSQSVICFYEQYVCSVPSFIIVNGELKPCAARRSGVVKKFQHSTSSCSGPAVITSVSDIKRQLETYYLFIRGLYLGTPKGDLRDEFLVGLVY